MIMDRIGQHRAFMKSNFALPSGPSDQQKLLPQPPLELPLPEGVEAIALPEAAASAPDTSLHDCLTRRRSRRTFSNQPVSLAELSYLLWATQGVQHVTGDGCATYRPVPSAGARHPFETYLAVNHVETLSPGLYRYLPLSHRVARLQAAVDLPPRLTTAALGQKFVGYCAVCFLWSCVPYRGEWRYGRHAHKAALLDAGHIGQNLYLACEALGLGTCAIGAYDQQAVDGVLGLDGADEFVVYLAPVGRVKGAR